MRSIAGLFGKSPFKSLTEHFNHVTHCVRYLTPLFEALRDKHDEDFRKAFEQICFYENEADGVKNALRNDLPRTLLMPVARPDVLVLLDVQDGIADTAQDIAVLLSVRKPAIPANFGALLFQLINDAVKSIDEVNSVYRHLNALVESTFVGKPAEHLIEHIDLVGEAEHNADKTSLQLMDQLFNHSGDMEVADLLIWDKVTVKIGHIADLSRKTSNRLRILLSR